MQLYTLVNILRYDLCCCYWQTGPQKVRGPICHKIGAGPNLLGPDLPGPDLPAPDLPGTVYFIEEL